MLRGVHPLVQDADNGDAVPGRPEIDNVPLDATPSVPGSDVGSVLRLMWSLGEIRAGGFDQIGVTHCLGQAPTRYRIIENVVQIALCAQAEPELSHIARLCAA